MKVNIGMNSFSEWKIGVHYYNTTYLGKNNNSRKFKILELGLLIFSIYFNYEDKRI
jgi:hypothetical protein